MIPMTTVGNDIVDPSEWMRQYESIEGAHEEMSNDLNDSQQKGIGNRQKRAMNKRVLETRDSLAKLERSLATMERNPMKYKIGEGEIQRRKGLLATLRSMNNTIDDQINNNDGRLIGNMPRRQVSLADESAESQQFSNAQLMKQQEAALSNQDQKLDGILDGVTRLKVMSNDINQELDLHASLLNELDDAVDQTDGKIQRNTKRVEIVTEESGGCCGIITMVFLFVIIVILLVTNWGCHLPNSKKDC